MHTPPHFSTKSSYGIRVCHHLQRRQPTPPSPKRLQQPSNQVAAINGEKISTAEFRQFVAREARVDQEYWAAAWLRAESHFEGRETDRYIENYKRTFAEQEFTSMKRRHIWAPGETYKCIVVVEEESASMSSNSVIGTLDLSIRYSANRATFPAGHIRDSPLFGLINGGATASSSITYGYVANLCVAKLARRQGIASNMLRFAILSAKQDGAEKVYVHVLRTNKAAQVLYDNMGFHEAVDAVAASSQLWADDQTCLLCFERSKYSLD